MMRILKLPWPADFAHWISSPPGIIRGQLHAPMLEEIRHELKLKAQGWDLLQDATGLLRVLHDSPPSDEPASLEEARKLLEAGHPVYFRVEPPRAILGAVEATCAKIGLPSKHFAVRLFVSRGAAMVPAHVDRSNGISIQVEGKKSWRIGSTSIGPGQSHFAQNEEFLKADSPLEIVAEAGQFLFIPAGCYHATMAEGLSVTANVCFHES